MPSKRIDELDARTVADSDLLPVTPSGGPSGRATVAAIVAEGLSQPNSASAGAGASITIKAADGVTSGAGGSIVLQPGAQATTGGNGTIQAKTNIVLYQTNSSENVIFAHSGDTLSLTPSYALASFNVNVFFDLKVGNHIKLQGRQGSGGGSIVISPQTANIIANTNNFVLNYSGIQRINCTTASDITGIAPPTGGAHVDGRMIRLVNVGTATVTLIHNSASSTAANRLYRHNATNLNLTVNEWADLVYDSTDNGSGAAGWRIVKYA